MNKIDKAKEIATKAHHGQTRWDKVTPYITHPEEVAKIAAKGYTKNNPYYEKIQIVAWLHDVVEDTTITIEDIRSQFGNDIAESIKAITKVEGEEYDEYIDRVASNWTARIVKIADITHNLSNLKRGSMRDKYRLARKYLLENKRYPSISLE